MKRSLLCLVLVTALGTGTTPAAEQPDHFKQHIQPLLKKYCNDCHGMPEEDPSGDLSLAVFQDVDSISAARRTWQKVLNAVADYEMPPQEMEQPTSEERQQLVGWIRGMLAEPEFGEHPNPGRPVLRRLTRLEYNNTVRDLLGLQTDVFMFSERLPFRKDYFDPAQGKLPRQLRVSAREYGANYPVLLPNAGLPGDSRAEHGFSNRGDAQNLSAVRLEQYVQLAEQIAFHPELLSRSKRIQVLFPNAKFEPQQEERSPRPKMLNTVVQLAPKNNVARTAAGSAFSLSEFQARIKQAFADNRGGVFDVPNNANGTIPGKGGVLHLAYGKNAQRALGINPSEDIWLAAFATAEESSGGALMTNKQGDRKQFFFGFQASKGQPWRGIQALGIVALSRKDQSGKVLLTAEFSDGKEHTVTVELKPGAGEDNTFVAFAAPENKTIKRLKFDGSGFSGKYVLLDDLAFITRDPPARPQQVVGLEEAEEEEVAPTVTTAESADESVLKLPPRERLAYFMRRAFRRPVESEEVDLYYQLYTSALARGQDEEFAMRSALHGILSSPNFLYLIESGQPQGEPVVALTDHELASRLSYFLWSSMPDDELLQLAEAGTLSDPQVLQAQTQRMLKSTRVRELSENFFVEWLRLRELWSAQPDRKAFRDFYDGPKGKRTLADDMFCEALLLFETILVEDRPIHELIHADYTYLNADLAQLYGLQNLFGDDRDWQRVTLPDANRGGVLTLGATLTLTSFPHRTSPIRRGAWFLETILNRPPPPPKVAVADIDEQKDLEANLTLREKVQRHRDNTACAVCHNRIDPPGFALENFDAIGRWRLKDGEEPIDPSGFLLGAGHFEGPAEFKQRLLEQKQKFVRGFVEHLLSYALARKLEYYDIATVEQISQAAAKHEYRLQTIVQEIVTSHTFRHTQSE